MKNQTPVAVRIKDFFHNNKHLLWSSLWLVLLVVAVSVLSLIILILFDVVYFEEGMQFNSELFMQFKSKWYGWSVFVLLQTVLSIFLCAIPGAAMAFTLLCMTIYTEPWQAFVISFVSMLIASNVLYWIGRSGGRRLCERFLGKKDCDRALTLLEHKGTVYFPIMMLFPTFPDEALTMIAGTIGMSLKWFLPSIIIGRGIGIATITFGLSAIPFEKFTSPLHWIGFIGLCIGVTVGVFYGAHRVNVFMEQRRNKGSSHSNEEQGVA